MSGGGPREKNRLTEDDFCPEKENTPVAGMDHRRMQTVQTKRHIPRTAPQPVMLVLVEATPTLNRFGTSSSRRLLQSIPIAL